MSINKLTVAPGGAIGVLASKINELIAAQKPLKAGDNIEIKESEQNILISAEIGEGGGGAGLPAGYAFEEFTICDSGTPATRWWPTWTTNPEA